MKRLWLALLTGLLLISCNTETVPEETSEITVSEEPEWLTPPEEPVTALVTREEDIPEGEMWIPVYRIERRQTSDYVLSPESNDTSSIYCYYPCVTINPVLVDNRMDVLLIEDGGLRLFDLRTGEITELPFSANDFTALSFADAPEAAEITEIVCTNDDNSLQIFDLKTNSFVTGEEKSPQ